MNFEALIPEIEKRPCLWDKGDYNYKNHIKKDSAWREIASIVVDKWADLDEKTQFGHGE